MFLPPVSTANRTSAFSPVGALSAPSYIPQTHSLPSWSPGLNLQPVQLVGGFWVFFLSHTAPGFHCGFISTSACGSATEVCSWGCPGGLGFAPGRARCGGGAAAWVAGVLAAPGTQGSWWLGQQEIQCSRRGWQPVLADTLQDSCLEKPPNREAWQATVYRVTNNQTLPKQPWVHRHKICFLPVAILPQRVECEGGIAAWLVGILMGPSVQGHGLPSPQGLWPYQSLFSSLL